MSDLYRVAFDVQPETDGRTVLGRAFYFDKPSIVCDPGGKPYREAFARACADRSIGQRKDGIFPLYVSHDYKRDAIGTVKFNPDGDAMGFEARLTPGRRDSDEALASVRAGVFGNVSVAFRAMKDDQAIGPDGPVVMRSIIALRELSLCSVGFNQHEGADVLALREIIEEVIEEVVDEKVEEEVAREGTPRLDALRRRLLML